METLSCSTPINLKRKSDEIPLNFEDSKRLRVESQSPRAEPAEAEATNNNYKSADTGGGGGGDESLASEPEVPGTGQSSRADMYQKYQPWLLATYGDLKKTKTITEKKYERIVRTLRGLIPNMAENSKFRFWIRTKGFCLGPPDPSGHQDLFVTCRRTSGETSYKRVAVVEKFFDIIYSSHVDLEGPGGRHAGQKRTYRAITERYAFLPREAVTRFLLGCVECQRRSDGDPSSTPKRNPQTPDDSKTPSPEDQTVPSSSSSAAQGSEPSPRNPDLSKSLTPDLGKLEPETSYRPSSDESRTSSSGHDPLESKHEHTHDSYNETPKSAPTAVNLTTIRRRIPLHSLEASYSDSGFSVIKQSGFPGFSPDRSNIEPGLRLGTSTPDSNISKSISDTTISKSSDSSGVTISPIEAENFQKPYPKKLYTIDPVTFETIRIPLKHTEISIYYERNRPYIKPQRRDLDSDLPPGSNIMSTYLKYMRSLGYSDEESLHLESEAVSTHVYLYNVDKMCSISRSLIVELFSFLQI